MCVCVLYILFTCACVFLFFYFFPHALSFLTVSFMLHFRRTQFYLLHLLLFNGVCFCHSAGETVYDFSCIVSTFAHTHTCTHAHISVLRFLSLSISRRCAAFVLHGDNLPAESRNVTRSARPSLAGSKNYAPLILSHARTQTHTPAHTYILMASFVRRLIVVVWLNFFLFLCFYT